MKSSSKILEVDPIVINHNKLKKAIGIAGLEQPYHDPKIGTTFIIVPRDKPFTIEWHEGAHSFITQRSCLGLILSLFSAILHVLFNEMDLEQLSDNEYKEKLYAFRRIRELRESIIQNFSLSHEIFAMISERRGIIEKSISEGGQFNKIIEKVSETIASLDIDVFKDGYDIHKKALDTIYKISDIYGHYLYIALASEWILNFAPCLITNVKASTLIVGKEEITPGIININNIYNSLIDNPPKWTPNPFVYNKITPFFEKLIENINLLSIYKNIFTNIRNLNNWLTELHSILPIGKKYRKLYDKIMANTLKYALIGGTERQNQLKKYAQFENKDKKTHLNLINKTDLPRFKKHLEDSLGFKLPDKKESISQEVLLIPPPLTLLIDAEGFRLYVRADINTPYGLFHMAYRTAEMGIIEDVLDKEPYPILCFFSYCDFKHESCKYGSENCIMGDKIKDLLINYENSNKKSLKPILICCKDNFSYFVEFKDSEYKPNISFRFPFKLIVFDPKLSGRRIIS